MSDQLNSQPLGHNPNASYEEMLAFRSTFNLKEHLAGRPQAAPVEPSLIHLSVAQLKMLCERAGLDVIPQTAADQAGGRLLNLEEKLEALKKDHDEALAKNRRLTADNADLRTLSDKLAARNAELHTELTREIEGLRTKIAEVASIPILITDIQGAVARGWCTDKNKHKAMDADLAQAISAEVASVICEAKIPIEHLPPIQETTNVT